MSKGKVQHYKSISRFLASKITFYVLGLGLHEENRKFRNAQISVMKRFGFSRTVLLNLSSLDVLS